jgi:hypothetical protein
MRTPENAKKAKTVYRTSANRLSTKFVLRAVMKCRYSPHRPCSPPLSTTTGGFTSTWIPGSCTPSRTKPTVSSGGRCL